MGKIKIGNRVVGIIGLSEAIAEAQRSGGSREEIAERLLTLISEKNYIPDAARKAYREALFREYLRATGELPPEEAPETISIKVLGPGCASCEGLYRLCLDIVAEMDLTADVEHVTSLKEIARYGLVPTPGLVINEELKCAGRIPARYQIEEWLREAGKTAA
ncbi:thioredoxin family protein [Thermosulfuriphilus sp.]